jgi:heterogeneous nuclear ribonucleoprotein F/H
MQEQEGGRLLAASVGAGTAGKEGGGEEQQTSLGETASAAAAALWGGAAGSPPMLTSTGSYGDPMAPQHLGHNPQLAGVGGRGGGGGPSRGGGLHAPMQKRTGGGIQVGEHTGFLRMRGLPFSAAKDDIYKFFQGYNPVQESIVLTYRNDGRATGEAYIGFASPEDSKRAMDLHRRSMGSRYIELFISNKDEQGRALARFGNR